jgi:4-hydroxy-tetrahydrodipicolinate synthase
MAIDSKSPFTGVNIAVATPQRTNSAEIDLAGALDIVDHAARAGVSGLALLGCTGEFLHFSIEERARFLSFAGKRTKTPILAGITHSSFPGTVALAEMAVGAGAAGLLAMPPYFFPCEQGEVLAFFQQLAERIGGGVPIFLYNVPAVTNAISLDTAKTLLGSGAFAGIKDSSGNWDYLSGLIEFKQSCPFTLLIGHDRLFARGRMAGADGVVSGVGCAMPELMLAIESAIDLKLSEKIQRLDVRLDEFLQWTYRFPVPLVIKEALCLRGLRPGPQSNPLSPQKQEDLETFRRWFADWLPRVLQETSDA